MIDLATLTKHRRLGHPSGMHQPPDLLIHVDPNCSEFRASFHSQHVGIPELPDRETLMVFMAEEVIQLPVKLE